MELETERLKVIPCTEETVEIAINQKYDRGPQISTHLKKLNEDPSLLYWGRGLLSGNQTGLSLVI
ncbi:hypothetical protein OSO01_07650 [Oceanobacillus sojae]|uniref:Uncharacterized protein n=1 Tax=Oceanobacillus sojae TaxID=582851 RepID=A0A511ZF10_9BACI|nr:hypothetical protein OSO01_07650 [Oceanobacillus sojae]